MGAAEAGAAIVHMHARDPGTAGPPRTRNTSPRSWTSSSATPTPSSTSPPAAPRT
ncbi:3-keto-5-aminohexanoate cleavage protein [Arthrobacter sp. OVS8]|nr:3-keto-5-aminohexanoate cleavage protein [Arthrobacter sp. OVS8]